jgi:hypothetical protein
VEVDVVEVVDVVDVVDVVVDVLGGTVGGATPMSITFGGSSGSMNVVVVVAGRVVDVVVVDVVDVLDDALAGIVVRGGMQLGLLGTEEAGRVKVGGVAAPAVWAAWAIEIAPTAIAASTTTGRERPAPDSRCTARMAHPATSATAPISSAGPTEPPEAGRLHTESMATGGRGQERDEGDANPTRHAAAVELQPVCNVAEPA